MRSKTGKILIAHPNLPANNLFYKSVVYVYDDTPNGTQGLILNKPSNYHVSDFLKNRGMDFPHTKETMRYGGPVRTNTVVMIHSDNWYSSSTTAIRNDIALSCDDFMFEKMAMGDCPSLYRIAVGICGWQTGQLNLELTGRWPYKPENSWLTAEADPSIVFEHDGERQWQKALELSSNQMIASYF